MAMKFGLGRGPAARASMVFCVGSRFAFGENAMRSWRMRSTLEVGGDEEDGWGAEAEVHACAPGDGGVGGIECWRGDVEVGVELGKHEVVAAGGAEESISASQAAWAHGI